MQSESIKELASSLAKAQGMIEHAKKDVKNEFYKSKYADLASCIDAVKIPLSSNGLSVVQTTIYENGDLLLETKLIHSSGEWISGIYPIAPVKKDPQGFGSAMTYARRYALQAIVGLAADDDDGNAASQAQKTQNTPPEQTPKQYDDFLLFLEKVINSEGIKQAKSKAKLFSGEMFTSANKEIAIKEQSLRRAAANSKRQQAEQIAIDAENCDDPQERKKAMAMADKLKEEADILDGKSEQR